MPATKTRRKATSTKKRQPAKGKATTTAKRTPAKRKPAAKRQQAQAPSVSKAQLAKAIALVHTTDPEAPAKGQVFVTQTKNRRRVWVRLEALQAPLAQVLGLDEPLGKLAVRQVVVEAHGFARQPFSYLSATNASGTDSRSYYYSEDKALTKGDEKRPQAKATATKAGKKAKAWAGRK